MSENTLSEKYDAILHASISMEELVKLGSTILDAQINMAKERALKNSKTGTFASGITCCVTCGPELINITHEQLHEQHPECQLTIVTRLKYANNKPNKIAHSIRSWDTEIDARKMIGQFGGGITASVAGGETDLEDHDLYMRIN